MGVTEKPRIEDNPSYSAEADGLHMHVKASGNWTIATIADVDEGFRAKMNATEFTHVTYDFSEVSKLDTGGAYVLAQAIRCNQEACEEWTLQHGTKGQTTLMQAAVDATMGRAAPTTRPWYDTLSRVGQATNRAFAETFDTLAFLGKFVLVVLRLLVNPHRIRWKSVVAQIEDVGLNAAPIIMILSFFIGAVIAFMGAELLASFGAQIFMVDLVGISVLREFAVLITAIMLAGRSDSAFTAQIGSMKMRQEIDAMTVIGLDTFETLVAPRAMACLISAPILTFLAMLSGIAGGMLVAWFGPTDISPVLFFARLKDVVSINHFWVGIVKAPVFAVIIAVIGCRQGLAVAGSVESLGERTTASVVQAIFSVIVVDAIFAMLFLEMDI